MTAAALISLRETLETSLIVGIMLTVLSRLNRNREQRWVWMGVGAGVVWSIALAILFQLYAASLSDAAKELYEGAMMLTAAGLLSWMILWMMRMGPKMRVSLQRDLTASAKRDHFLGIFLLSFTGTAREGTELVLFLHAAFLSAQSDIHHFVGALAGMIGAVLLAFMFFRSSRRFSLKHFFTVTSVLLLLFGAGLTAYGIGELQEARLLSFWSVPVWNSSWLLSEDGAVGSMAHALLGYSAAPSGLQVAAYIAYLAGAGGVWRRMKRTRVSGF